MVHEIDITDYLKKHIPLIDVRSPGEFRKGHIPGAVNVPLFTDIERAHLGTVYTKYSAEKAVELAFHYVKPKLEDIISESGKIALNGQVVVCCWRGGMRSRSFAQHLVDNGFKAISMVIGGYKAYRAYLHGMFDVPYNLKIIGGYTGSGKTLVIQQLQKMGFQAVDLEELARHKGSAFGAVEGQVQPTVEQFENNLFNEWLKLDYSQSIWLEDESHNIGGVNIPVNLYNQMQKSPVYFLDIPKKERAKYLVSEYTNTSGTMLTDSINRISRRLGGQNTKYALQLLSEKKRYEAALLCLNYYDKSYLKGMRLHDQEKIIKISRPGINPVENAAAILNILK
ncbi:MAG: tRNA 2-selenouridine(34) synthase MnmH [Bacteroidales bacterium]|nr:tRNA 2-selenouridine(34) synthase MnmH [Bacteroidales bacterium]